MNIFDVTQTEMLVSIIIMQKILKSKTGVLIFIHCEKFLGEADFSLVSQTGMQFIRLVWIYS